MATLLIGNIPTKKTAVWHAFFSKTTTLYVGDAFGMQGQLPTGKIGWMNDWEFHNLEDYYKFMQLHPELKDTLIPAHFHFVHRGTLEPIRDLSALFTTHNQSFDIRFTSDARYHDFREAHLIYVGLPTKKMFTDLFHDANPYCQLLKGKFVVKGNPLVNDTILAIHSTGKDPYEYAVVLKVNGVLNNQQFFFLCRHEMGNMATVNYFTNEENVARFEREKLMDKENFTAIYRVHGKGRLDIKFEEVLVIPF